MADIPGNSSTTAPVTVGSTTPGSLEVVGDHDWYRITLAAGQEITVTLNRLTLEDPYLRIRNAAGIVLFENDDINPGVVRGSKLSFVSPSSGTYFIDVGAFDDNYAGNYQLVVANYEPPPVATIDQIADHLTSGYWGGTSHHFNVTQGGSITVNITGLTDAGQNLAREALAVWSDIIGVNFTEVASGAKIQFDDNEPGAHSDGIWSGGIISSANVNVSTQWLASYGSTLNSYGFQTYIHEVGHALGLGHGGHYNQTAGYRYDALFANDGLPTTIMSYFNQTENAYFGGLGFTDVFALTPMLADVLAVSQLYGPSTTTRAGDTIYGFNSNADRAVFNPAIYPSVAYTIFDSGGVDTLDYSGFYNAQKISLMAETFSNIGANVGNVVIARGVVIENAIGGSGSDEITGNAANNVLNGGAGGDALSGLEGDDTLIGGSSGDILTGGAGADTFRDTAANLNFDSITDFTAQDRIIVVDANFAGFSFSLVSSTLYFTGGQLTLGNFVGGALLASAAAGGGVQLLQASRVQDDFNGDGRSDMLWRNDNGTLTDWLATANGGFVDNYGALSVPVSIDWKIAGTGDFNGDGRDDILWRNDSGALTDWLGTASGGFVENYGALLLGVPTDWSIAGTGDFNGDGRDDILWRNANGALTDWLGAANGAFAENYAALSLQVSTDWKIAGTGDFNGDGRDDILWRNDNGTLTNWLGTANGAFVENYGTLLRGVPNDWKIVGTGDFNGDGRDDILWRNDNGALTDWLGTASGGFTENYATLSTQVPTDWRVAGTGDFNGDGRDDILWRNDSGALTDWLGTASGGFVENFGAFSRHVSTDWHVQPDYFMA